MLLYICTCVLYTESDVSENHAVEENSDTSSKKTFKYIYIKQTFLYQIIISIQHSCSRAISSL